MLYCLCYDSWENDSDRIAQIHTSSLIQELRRQITTQQDLQNRLRIILLRLNRKTKYAPVADISSKSAKHSMLAATAPFLYPAPLI